MAVPTVSITVTLKVTDLPMEITEDQLLQHFGRYDNVTNPMIAKHPEQREPPWAIVRFHNPSRAEEALSEENHMILGQRVKVERVGQRQPTLPLQCQANPRKVFVGGLPPGTTEGVLYDSLVRFGEITECFIPTDHSTGQRRRFGFVIFQDEESVSRVLDGDESRFHEIEGASVEVKRATPRLGFSNGLSRR